MNVVFDGSFDGFLTAVFDVYAWKIQNPLFRDGTNFQQGLFNDSIYIESDRLKAARVRRKLEDLFTKPAITQFWKATLVEEESLYQDLFAIISQGLSTEQNVLGDFGNVYVVRFHDALKRVGRERHRMTAFVRFELTTDNVYTAIVEPDFNVLPLLVSHFKNRYADQKWFIFDQKRKYGIYRNLHDVQPVEFCLPQPGELSSGRLIEWSDDEYQFQNLWKTYYKSATIQTRKNTRLHLRHVPKRYWKYLSEKHPD